MGVSIGELIRSVNDPIRLGAMNRNGEFVRLIRDETMRLFMEYKSRLGRPTGMFHDTLNNRSGYYPYIGREVNPKTILSVVDMLKILVSYNLVGESDELDVRRIYWDDGSGEWLDANNYTEIDTLNKLGYPGVGQFSPTDRRRRPNFDYVSFTAVDATVLIAMGPRIFELPNLATISYSIYRGKSDVRPFGKTYPTSFTRGTRTVAGTMVFVETIEHPLVPIYPSSIMPKDMEIIRGRNQIHAPTLLSDQLPPFDMIIVWQNEYGHAKQMAIYGIDIVQDGATKSTQDLVDEVVIEYKARDIDLPREVVVGRDGTVDPFSLSRDDISSFWERRWAAANSASIHEDFFTKTQEYYDQIDETQLRRMSEADITRSRAVSLALDIKIDKETQAYTPAPAIETDTGEVRTLLGHSGTEAMTEDIIPTTGTKAGTLLVHSEGNPKLGPAKAFEMGPILPDLLCMSEPEEGGLATKASSETITLGAPKG